MSLFQFSIPFDSAFYAKLDLNTASKIVRNGNTGKNISALSNPSKLNCFGWSISVNHCSTGGLLKEIPGTICNKCYAARGKYTTPSSQKAMAERYDAWQNQSKWVESMSFLINVLSHDKFRWFDSGDIQGFKMLLQITEIARHTPDTKHWLPTHEIELVKNFIQTGYEIPKNLTIRLSAQDIDGEPHVQLAKELNQYPNVQGFIGTSTVYTKQLWIDKRDRCPAPKQGNNCGSCTKCWDKVNNIGYKKH